VLLVCLVVMAISSVVLLGLLNSSTVRLSAARNSADYEKALYLAGAGIHHALAEIEADPTWHTSVGGLTAVEFPAGSGNTYTVTCTPGADDDEVILTSTGVAGDVTRRLQVTISLDG